MLGVLKQLNSEPVVVLTKLRRIEEEIKKQITKQKVLEEHGKIPSELVCSAPSPVITVTQSVPSKSKELFSGKRKASLEDALNEADTVYFKKSKKSKRDVEVLKNSLNDLTIGPRRMKSERSLLKIKLFKTCDRKLVSDSDLTKSKSYEGNHGKNKSMLEEKQKNIQITGQETNSVPPATCIPLLAYLELMPRPELDEQTDDELPEFPTNPSSSRLPHVEGDLPRSDSVETVALEELRETNQSENSTIECVNLISPSPSPTSIISEQLEAFESRNVSQSMPLLKEEEPSVPSTSAAEPATLVEKRSSSRPEEAETAREASTDTLLQDVSAPPSIKALLSSTDISYSKKNPEERTDSFGTSANIMQNFPEQISDAGERRETDTLQKMNATLSEDKELGKRSDNIITISNVTSSPASIGTPLGEEQRTKETLVYLSSDLSIDPLKVDIQKGLTEEGSGIELDGPAAKPHPSTVAQATILNEDQARRPLDNLMSTNNLMNIVSKDSAITSMFNEAFGIGSSASTPDSLHASTNSIQLPRLEERKLAVIHELNELKKTFQQIMEIAKPHEHSLRMRIFHYDSVKAELQAKEKENGQADALVRSKGTESESLQMKCLKFAEEKKKAQQESLETEIRLREQQMELCREQLQLGINHILDKSHPKFHIMRERQETVEKLSKEVSEKNAVLKKVEESIAQLELVLKKVQKDLRASLDQQKDGKQVCEKLNKQLQLLKSEITEKAAVGQQHFDKQKELWLKGLSLREEYLKIDSLERLEDLRKRREQAQSQYYTINNMLRSRYLLSHEEAAVATSSTVETMKESSTIPPLTTNDVNPIQIADNELAVLSHAAPSSITLEELAEAVPYYAHYLDNSKVSGNVCSDESVLCRNVVRGCRQYGIWKSTYLGKPVVVDSLDEKTLKQISAYMKEFVIPLFQLWTMKHSTGSSILNLIINEGFKNNWYGFPSLDPFIMRSMLEANVREAIQIGKKFHKKINVTTSALVPRFEYQTVSSESPSPIATSHPLPSSECSSSGPKQTESQFRVRNMFEGPVSNDQNTNLQEEHSSSVQAELPIQTQFSMQFPTTLATNMNQSRSQTTSPQVWTNTKVGNGIVAIQSTVVQNTAVVLPMPNNQYSGQNPHYIPMVSIQQPAPQATTSQQYRVNSSCASNPNGYSQSTFQQYPQRFNQYSINSYPNIQPSQNSPVSQEILNDTNFSTGPPRNLPQTITQGMQSQQVTTSQIPVVQQQNPIGRIHHHPAQVQPSRKVMDQQRIATTQVANAQNRPQMNRPLQQNAVQRPLVPNQQNVGQRLLQRPVPSVQQQTYTCSYCRGEAHQKCSGCQSAFYCSALCQMAHWEEHRISCRRR